MRTCAVCGATLPEDACPTRKYCLECAAARDRASKHRARQRAEQRAREKAAAEKKKGEYFPRRLLAKEDEKYCAPCRYVGNFEHGYLCNYLCITGHRRGCRAGKGCEKREKK